MQKYSFTLLAMASGSQALLPCSHQAADPSPPGLKQIFCLYIFSMAKGKRIR